MRLAKCESWLTTLESVLPPTECGPKFTCTSPQGKIMQKTQRVKKEMKSIFRHRKVNEVSQWYMFIPTKVVVLYSFVYFVAFAQCQDHTQVDQPSIATCMKSGRYSPD